MAIKQRALKELHTTKNNILRVMSTGSKAALDHVCRDLAETRDLYREGLSPQNYIAYGEIFDGLILAVRTMIENGEENFQEDVFVLCQELLEHLEKETAKETRFKKEIFFLPYKASMWDSLESVWKAACEDKEHCIAYVMPIPYADRTPDQTVAAWHCERDQFPKYVPTLDWQQVNLKAWHSDIIFYHNPYDNCNAVTSVDEQYYSRNLRHCADKLVYIPYFVLDEIEPGNQSAEENIAHFITAPGVLNADLIVVQSEKMRQVYIHVLARHTNQGEEYWKAHVSGAGSPKIEKVLTSKKEDFDMPEKWRKLVEGKKVILYNTSLSAMLQNSDKVCDKLRYVFDVFRDRYDVVLWWRPHPLMKATFHSMRPEIEKEYLKIEKQYIEEGWGIYDDTPDLHRAICWSDAYYGDYSSVMTLYKWTQKPTMVEDICSLGMYKSTSSIIGRCAVVDGDDFWIFSVYANCLLRFSIKTERLCEFYPFPENPWDYAVFSFVKSDRYLYFAPCYAEECWRFDIRNQKFEIVDIGFTNDEKQIQDKFRSSAICDGKLYMFGWNLPTIIALDLANGKYERIDGWISELEAMGLKLDGALINMYCTVEEHSIYVPIQSGPYILSVYAENNQYSLKRISSDEHEYFCAMYCQSEKLHITNNKDETIVWDLKNDNIHRVKNNFLSGNVVEYGYVFTNDDGAVYIPFTFSFIGYKTSDAKSFRQIKIPMDLLKEHPDGTWCKYGFALCVDGVLYLQSIFDGRIYAVRLDEETVRQCDFSGNEQLLAEIQMRKKKLSLNENQKPFSENGVLSLNKFLEADVEKNSGLLLAEKHSVGDDIYNTLNL